MFSWHCHAFVVWSPMGGFNKAPKFYKDHDSPNGDLESFSRRTAAELHNSTWMSKVTQMAMRTQVDVQRALLGFLEDYRPFNGMQSCSTTVDCPK
jgi:hypothetical protein